jgi:hypothetical protein
MKPRPIRQAPRRGLHFQQETKSDSSALRDPFTASSRTRRSVKGKGKKRSRTSERPRLVLSSCPAGDFVSALESPKSPSPDRNTDVGVSHLASSPDGKYTFTRLDGNRAFSCRRRNNFDWATHLRETQFDPLVYMIPELDLSPADKSHETDRLESPLSQSERLSLYEFLDGNIRPANGIEESVGSYKSYMADQSRHYYQRLFPGMVGSTQASRYLEGVNSSAGAMQDTVNFRKWLVSVPQANSTSSCAVNKTALSPCSTPRKQGRSSNCDIHITHSRLEEDFIFSFSPEVAIDGDHCLDALFPNMLSSDAVSGFNAAWGSPVVRSRITKALSTMSTGEYHGDYTSQGDIVPFSNGSCSPLQGKVNPLATDSVCQGSGKEERFLLLAPSFSLSRRLRTGHSLVYDDHRALRTQLTVDTDCDKPISGPYLPFQAPSPRSVVAPRTPGPNRLRSRSLSAFHTRSRTISAGGGI